MTTTHTLTGTVRILLVDGERQAHSEWCAHEGTHIGTATAPGHGTGTFFFTGTLGPCVRLFVEPAPDCAHPLGGIGEDNRCPDCDTRVGWGRLPLIEAGLVQS